MRRSLSGPVALCVVLAAPFAARPAQAQVQAKAQAKAQAQAKALRQRLANAPRTHPRLCLDSGEAGALARRIAADPRLQRTFDFVRRCADVILAAKPSERRKTGRRLLGVSRTYFKRVTYLALAHLVTQDPRYARRAQREMLAAAAFEDWNPSHFLDVAEMTAALAIGYDWLHGALEVKARQVIRNAIVTKGLKTSLRGGWWVQTTNNWNQVCHGGLTLGALAVLEDEPELAARILGRAITNLPRAMREYEPDGAYPEGPGYWVYGTQYNVLLLDALRTALGTDFGLGEKQGFGKAAAYYLHATGPTGLYFNYSDCGKRGGIAPAMYWFAQRDPSVLWQELGALDTFVAAAKPAADQRSRMLAFVLLWARLPEKRTAPPTHHFLAHGRTPVAMHRSGWNRDATYVAIKGGSPHTNHAHMDIGSFVMDAGGVRWAMDLGSQSYHSLESKGIRLWDRGQDAQRWTVFRLSTFAHNTLVVDGKQQRVKGNAPIIKHTSKGPMPHTVLDLGSVYRGQLAAARRGIGLRTDGSVLVQDEIETLDRPTRVRWGMLTRAEIAVRDGVAVLSRGGEKLTLRVLSPADATIQVVDTAIPRAAYDHPNQGTRMVTLRLQLPAHTKTRVAVWLTPGTEAHAVPRLRTLADW